MPSAMPGITSSAGWNSAKSSDFSSRTSPAGLVSGVVSLSFLFAVMVYPLFTLVCLTKPNNSEGVASQGKASDMQSVLEFCGRDIAGFAITLSVVFCNACFVPVEVCKSGERDAVFTEVELFLHWIIFKLHIFIVVTKYELWQVYL